MTKTEREALRQTVAQCCGDAVGKQMCSNYGCRNIEALLDECDRLEQASEDRRTALGQEIRNSLKVRGYWVPKELASSDLILAVAKALDKIDRLRECLAGAREDQKNANDCIVGMDWERDRLRTGFQLLIESVWDGNVVMVPRMADVVEAQAILADEDKPLKLRCESCSEEETNPYDVGDACVCGGLFVKDS